MENRFLTPNAASKAAGNKKGLPIIELASNPTGNFLEGEPDAIMYDGRNASLLGISYSYLLYYSTSRGTSEQWLFKNRSAMHRFVLERAKKNPKRWLYTIDTGDPSRPMFLTATLDELKQTMKKIIGDELTIIEPQINVPATVINDSPF